MINNVFIWGSKSCLLGDGNYIVFGAVVTKNVKKNSIIIGNPGKHVKMNKHFHDDNILKKILAYKI